MVSSNYQTGDMFNMGMFIKLLYIVPKSCAVIARTSNLAKILLLIYLIFNFFIIKSFFH